MSEFVGSQKAKKMEEHNTTFAVSQRTRAIIIGLVR